MPFAIQKICGSSVWADAADRTDRGDGDRNSLRLHPRNKLMIMNLSKLTILHAFKQYAILLMIMNTRSALQGSIALISVSSTG